MFLVVSLATAVIIKTIEYFEWLNEVEIKITRENKEFEKRLGINF